MARKGETWNESETYEDPFTNRRVRRITTQGLYNQTPTYHTNVGFSADGEFLIFGSAREGKSAIFRCHVPTGDITQLIEPVDGVGGYGELNRGVSVGDGLGVTGTMCLAPRRGWAVYVVGRSVRAVDIQSMDERILVLDVGADWLPGMPTIDPDETVAMVPLTPAHPDVVSGKRPKRSWMEHFAERGARLRLLQVPLAGGDATTVYEEDGITSGHIPHCPTDPDLLLIDRDFPPRFWGGSDGATNRIWTLRLSTRHLTELPPRDPGRFQVHSTWTWDGQNVLYHGRSPKGGWYMGMADQEGQVVWEHGFHGAEHYGHLTAAAGRPAFILDGNLSDDLLVWLYYDEERPRVEAIARHGTDWGALPGQYPHPHPLSDPTGRWVSFNAARRGRSDVFVVSV